MFYVLLNNYNLLAKILILLGFCKYFLDFFFFYFTSTESLLIIYRISTI